MARPRVRFSLPTSEPMELTRLSSVELESDEGIARADGFISHGSIEKTLPTSSLVEKGHEPASQRNKQKGRNKRPWDRWKRRSGLRTGLQVGLGISIFAFTANLILLAVGAITKPGYEDGISVLHRGSFEKITKLFTAYQVFINLLSTGLLTSSSYCMQLLCAPRREQIDAVHSRGTYIDIGILSFRSLKYISRYRLVLVLTLVITSVPLHLLYNSAIFGVVAGQDYTINFVDSRDTALIRNLNTTMTNLTNERWRSLYKTEYVPNSGDLFLVLDAVSFDIKLEVNSSTWIFTEPENRTSLDSYSTSTWQAVLMNTSMPFTTTLLLNESTGTFEVLPINLQPDQRVVVPLENYSNFSMPAFNFPEPISISAGGRTWDHNLYLNPDSWIRFPPFHISYAFSDPAPSGCSIQISLAFMLVVVICNALKILVIYRTLKEPLASQILTFGDAVSSFLEHPDPTTVGFCTIEKEEIVDRLQNPHSCSDLVKPWEYRRIFLGDRSVGRWASSIFIWSAAVISFVTMIVIILLARPSLNSVDWDGATLPIAWSSFRAEAILFNTWLANVPQIVLSMAYFALNRVCTSICFTREWNAYSIHRKGLRTSETSGERRPAYFVQLPYRWAVPLTAISGVLHWLLSRSFYLIVFEIRDEDGIIVESSSVSAVGYSNRGLLIFTTTYLATLLIVIGLQLRKMTLRIPPAAHCSLVISAACHPPPGDDNAQLKKVQWGVVRKRFGGGVEHCSFTSEEVLPPESGKLYA